MIRLWDDVGGLGRDNASSQWGEDHEYLIAVIAWGEPERAGPMASHCPAEPGVEPLQPGPAADGEAKLLQAHL